MFKVTFQDGSSKDFTPWLLWLVIFLLVGRIVWWPGLSWWLIFAPVLVPFFVFLLLAMVSFVVIYFAGTPLSVDVGRHRWRVQSGRKMVRLF